MGYLRRQLVIGALTANAVRPLPLYAVSVPSMFGGWLASELAPHLAAVTAVDTVRELLRDGGHRRLALVGAANLAGLAYVLRGSMQSHRTFESALTEGLGQD